MTDDFEECDHSLATSTKEKEVQTDETIHISLEQYQQLVQKAATYVDFKGDLDKIINYFTCIFNQSPIMVLVSLKESANDIMSQDKMSNERKHFTQLRAMVVIYVMIYSRSQKNNWFQITLARTLQQFWDQ